MEKKKGRRGDREREKGKYRRRNGEEEREKGK